MNLGQAIYDLFGANGEWGALNAAVNGVVAHEGEIDTHRCPLCQQLGIDILAEAADVGAVEGLAAQSERQRHGHAEFHLVYRREIVASPRSSIAVAAKEIGARQDERALIGIG